MLLLSLRLLPAVTPVEVQGAQGSKAVTAATAAGGIWKHPEVVEKVEEEPDDFHVEESDEVEDVLDELEEEPEGQ